MALINPMSIIAALAFVLDMLIAFQTDRSLTWLKHHNHPQFKRYRRLHLIFNNLGVVLLIITGWQLAKGHYALMLGTYLIVLLGDTLKWHRIWQAAKS
ncbi:MAG TPA: hypothetical protein DCP87_06230 [Lactobacillus sp.]|jgi:uncharacterized membrane protein|nr:hypothetical protein [Lactobacillus sp.]